MTNNSIVLYKTSIEVAQPKESADLLYIHQFGPLQNSVNLFRVHFDPIIHTKEVDFGDPKVTLLWFDK